MEQSPEQRIAALEEAHKQQQAASRTLQEAVNRIDIKQDELRSLARATQIQGTITEARLNTLDRQFAALQHEIQDSFQQQAGEQVQLEARLTERLSTMDADIKKIIDLLSHQGGKNGDA